MNGVAGGDGGDDGGFVGLRKGGGGGLRGELPVDE